MGTIIPKPITVSNEIRPTLLPRIEISHFGQDIKFSDKQGKNASKDKFTKWADDYISFIKNSGVHVAYINIGDYNNDKKFNYSYLDPSLGTDGVTPWIVTEFLDKLPAGVEVGALPYLKESYQWKLYDDKNFSGNTYTTDGKLGSPPKNNVYQAFELVNNINYAQLKAGGTKFITHFQADGEGAGSFEDDTYYGFGGEAESTKSAYNPGRNKITPDTTWSWTASKAGGGGTANGWPKAGYGYTKWLFNHFMPGVDATAASAADGSKPLVGSKVVPNVVFSDAQAIEPNTWSPENKKFYQFGIIKYSQTSWLEHSPGPMKAYTENYWFGENHYRPGPGSSVAPDEQIKINGVPTGILNGPDTDPFKTAPEVVFNKPTKGTAAQGYAVVGKGAISDFDKYTHAFFGAGLGEGYSTGVKIIDGGSGYKEGSAKSDLNITFSPPDDPQGRRATGYIEQVDSSGKILGIRVQDPGTGYSKEPTITLPKTSGKKAETIALITPENGYPQVVFPAPNDPDGIQAAGYAQVSTQAYKAGQITGLQITEPGSGYLQHKLNTTSDDPLADQSGGLKVIFKSESGSGAPPIYLPVNTGSGQIDHIVLTVLGDGYNAQDDQPFYTLTGVKTKHYLKGGINNDGINPNYSGSYVPVLNLAGEFRVEDKTQLADLTIIDRGAGYSAGVIITNGGSGYDSKGHYPVTFSGGGGSEQATGLLEVNDIGVATGVRITNPGSGYTSEPNMEIPTAKDGTQAKGTVHLLNYPKVAVSGGSFKPGGGTPAEAYAVTANPDPNNTANPDTGYIISGIGMTDRGLAYKEAPTFTITGNAPNGRAAEVKAFPALASKHAVGAANVLPTITETLGQLEPNWSGTIEGGANAYNWQVSNGYGPGQVINPIKIPIPGSGYTSAPTVTFSAPTRTGGKTATGKAILGTGDKAGTVIKIEITDAGYGYKDDEPPEITISKPASGTVAKATATLGDVLVLSPRALDTNYAYYADHPEALAAMFNNEYYKDVSLPKLGEKFYWPLNWNDFTEKDRTDGTKTPQHAIATFSIESLNRSNVNPKDPKTPVATALDAKYHSDARLLIENKLGGTFAGLSSLTYDNFVKFLNESATIIADEANKGGAAMKAEDVTFQIYDAAFLPLEWLSKQNTNSWSLNDSDAVLDLTEIPATGSTLHFSITSDADHTNRFGLVKVDTDDLTGSYSVAGESVANTDSFREAVSDNLINPGDGNPITLTGKTNRSFSWDLRSSDAGLYAPVLINTDGEVLTIGSSASDGNIHLKALGNNTFGFEDLLLSDLSDWDHNDFVVQVSLDPLA